MVYNSSMAAARPTQLKNPTRRNVIIEDALWRKVQDQAKAEDRTVSSLVRMALKEYLDRGR